MKAARRCALVSKLVLVLLIAYLQYDANNSSRSDTATYGSLPLQLRGRVCLVVHGQQAHPNTLHRRRTQHVQHANVSLQPLVVYAVRDLGRLRVCVDGILHEPVRYLGVVQDAVRVGSNTQLWLHILPRHQDDPSPQHGQIILHKKREELDGHI